MPVEDVGHAEAAAQKRQELHNDLRLRDGPCSRKKVSKGQDTRLTMTTA